MKKAGSLSGSLLARKGDAAPAALPADPVAVTKAAAAPREPLRLTVPVGVPRPAAPIERKPSPKEPATTTTVPVHDGIHQTQPRTRRRRRPPFAWLALIVLGAVGLGVWTGYSGAPSDLDGLIAFVTGGALDNGATQASIDDVADATDNDTIESSMPPLRVTPVKLVLPAEPAKPPTAALYTPSFTAKDFGPMPTAELDRIERPEVVPATGPQTIEAESTGPVETPSLPAATPAVTSMAAIDELIAAVSGGDVAATVASPPAPRLAAAVAQDGRFALQLAAVKSRAAIESERTRFLGTFPEMFDGAELIVQPPQTDGGYFRLATPRLSDKKSAERLCRWLKSKRQNCLIVSR